MTHDITDEQREQWREMGRASRRRQGLPEHITDVTVLEQAAAIYGTDRAEGAA